MRTTGFGRYPYLKKKERINLMLKGLEGLTCLIDDILIYGKDER